ncbi:MAG: hypothetical protein IPH53_00870 [Flavobacteriales bacterium]|nr:hypothetical protein [Flavobacteriales bacterium]MBK7083290.1 hypothetical protein [Flavobacteriales bacterium]MBK9076342.1 hypothetical protein [Flavobacteriales bacterium]
MSLRTAWPLLVAAFLLLLPALFNGYPLVYSDTGTYLSSGFQLGVPADRPIAYGLFCRIASLNGRTLWGPIVVQALLTAVLLWSGWRNTVGDRRWGHFAVAVGVLSVCTGMGWYAGRLLPDAFTPLLVLASIELLFKRSSWLWTLFLLAMIGFACATHFSHLLIAPGMVLFAWVLRAISGGRILRPDPRGTLLIGLALVLSVIGLRESNRMAGYPAQVSRGNAIFLVGRMLDSGVLRPGLDRHCPEEEWTLCGRTLPARSRELLWGSDSPITVAGGWDEYSPEAEAITSTLLADTRTWTGLVGAGMRDGIAQLTQWGVGEIAFAWYRNPVSPPYLAVQQFVPHELDDYLASRQNGGLRGELELRGVDRAYMIVLVLGLLGMITLLFRGSVNPMERTLLLVLLLASAFAAMSCAALSMPDQRFLARVSWLVPWAVALVAMRRL